MTVPTPVWSRPDDAVRQAQLDAMKRRATGLLALAAAVFGAATAFEGQYPWLGYVRATAEASLVGGLADWFAVTALFRRPLGLPIPHTAIVATRKERIGRILGNFVQNHFLSRDVIALNLRAVHPAERAARWLSDPAHSRQIARQLAGGLAKTLEALPDEDARELVRQVVSTRVRATRVAPALGGTPTPQSPSCPPACGRRRNARSSTTPPGRTARRPRHSSGGSPTSVPRCWPTRPSSRRSTT